MADNLSISIGIDTAKLRADAAIVKEELRKVNEQVRAAAKAGDVTAVRAGAAEQDRLVRSLGAVNQQIRTNTVLKLENTRATNEATGSLRQYGLELGHLAHAAGLPIEGIRSLRAGILAFAGVEIIRGLTAVSEKITQITDLAKRTGGSTQGIQVLTKALEETGAKAEDATEIFQKMGQIWQSVQKQALESGRTLGGAQVMKGGTKDAANEITGFGNSLVNVLHGGRQLGTDFSSIFTALQIDPKTIKSFDDLDIKIKRAIVALHDAGQTVKANSILVEYFGKTWAEVGEGLRQTVKQFDEVKAKTHIITPEEIAANEAYTKSLNELSDAWNSLARQIATLVFPQVTAFFGDLTKGIADSIEQIKTLVGWFQSLINLAQQAGSAVASVVSGAGSAIASAASAVGAAAKTPLFGNAAGGYIRGAGSGTSDSILARLSNGEFVMNAGSVSRLGVGFLQGLNNFAAGGLVGVPPIRFAAGGLASAGGNAIASFHFESGNSFKLGGPVDVVNAMVSEAHAQQVRSAGVKPSWFAARPSGR